MSQAVMNIKIWHTTLAWAGGPNSDDWRKSLVLWLLCDQKAASTPRYEHKGTLTLRFKPQGGSIASTLRCEHKGASTLHYEHKGASTLRYEHKGASTLHYEHKGASTLRFKPQGSIDSAL